MSSGTWNEAWDAAQMRQLAARPRRKRRFKIHRGAAYLD
jgi:hypothetical protein